MGSMIRNFPRWIRSRRSRLYQSGFLILILVFLEWYYEFDYSLGILYIFPVILAASVLNRWQIVLAAVVCAYTRGLFTPQETFMEHILRFAMAAVAYAGSGLLVVEITTGRRKLLRQYTKVRLEQTLRHSAERQLNLLIESSPAAILTLDHTGHIVAANRAAHETFAIEEEHSLLGSSISSYLAILDQALHLSPDLQQIRTSATTWGRRSDGSTFPAATWFSIYGEGERRHLSAIVVDNSEEVRDRERANFQHLLDYNRLFAGAVSHEIRNLCSAISVVVSNLEKRNSLAADPDIRSLQSLAGGLNKIASFDLRKRTTLHAEPVSLQKLCDQLRLIIESDWNDIGGRFDCQIPDDFPLVNGDLHGLLQVLLNLSQNSLRAVAEASVKRLSLSAEQSDGFAVLRISDSGRGIASPEHLFHPFRKEANGAGLGLYVSRALVQSLEGDLRHIPTTNGCTFELTLPLAEQAVVRYGT